MEVGKQGKELGEEIWVVFPILLQLSLAEIRTNWNSVSGNSISSLCASISAAIAQYCLSLERNSDSQS